MSASALGTGTDRLRTAALQQEDADRIGGNMAEGLLLLCRAKGVPIGPEPPPAAMIDLAAGLEKRREQQVAELRTTAPLTPDREARFYAEFAFPFDQAILAAIRRRWRELAESKEGQA